MLYNAFKIWSFNLSFMVLGKLHKKYQLVRFKCRELAVKSLTVCRYIVILLPQWKKTSAKFVTNQRPNENEADSSVIVDWDSSWFHCTVKLDSNSMRVNVAPLDWDTKKMTMSSEFCLHYSSLKCFKLKWAWKGKQENSKQRNQKRF